MDDKKKAILGFIIFSVLICSGTSWFFTMIGSSLGEMGMAPLLKWKPWQWAIWGIVWGAICGIFFGRLIANALIKKRNILPGILYGLLAGLIIGSLNGFLTG